MTTRKQRIQLRNQRVKEYFNDLEKKHPQWKLSALLEETANHFPPIAPATVSAILKESGSYSA
jgi:hypothetical protein